MLDPSGEYWRIKQQDIFVFPDDIEDKVNIKLVKTKDASNNDIMGAGAIYRRAEMFNGGTYKVFWVYLRLYYKQYESLRLLKGKWI